MPGASARRKRRVQYHHFGLTGSLLLDAVAGWSGTVLSNGSTRNISPLARRSQPCGVARRSRHLVPVEANLACVIDSGTLLTTCVVVGAAIVAIVGGRRQGS